MWLKTRIGAQRWFQWKSWFRRLTTKLRGIANRILSVSGLRGKTLWDVVRLLSTIALPVILLFLGHQLSEAQRLAQLEIEEDRQREAAMQTYLQNLAELMLDGELRTAEEESDVRDVARVQALTTFRRLDPNRKGLLLQFLFDAELINTKTITDTGAIEDAEVIIDLFGADLTRANLAGSYLPGVNLIAVDLRGADLGGAFLNHADLRGASLAAADLNGAKLQAVNLDGADMRAANLCNIAAQGSQMNNVQLSQANLTYAGIQGAELRSAVLRGADLRHANLEEADLTAARLQGADLGRVQGKDAELSGAFLNNAELIGANLEGANLTGAFFTQANMIQTQLTGATVELVQLANAFSLFGAILPDGNRYDGRFELDGDIDRARAEGVLTSNADAMERWYQQAQPAPNDLRSEVLCESKDLIFYDGIVVDFSPP